MACVYNRQDRATRDLVEEAEVVDGCRAIGFGLDVPGPSDVGIVDEFLVDRAFLPERHSHALELTTRDDLEAAGLVGAHLVADVLAAAALARAAGIEPADIRRAIRGFRLDAHRIELVARIDGVVWIDDSKATNAHAADAALSAHASVVWIVGGLLKGVDPEPLVARHAGRLRAVVVIGEERSVLLKAFERHAPGVPVLEVSTSQTDQVMSAAVRAAASVAQSGDVVLLAPAAASMDQFTDYADRGRQFTAAVQERLGGARDDDADTSGGPTPA